MSVALATCALLPDLDEDERSVIAALAERGVDAVARVWDDPAVAWDEHELVVIRSTWDYAERRDAYLAWSGSLRRVRNAHPVIVWNTDKVYLRSLGASGLPIVPTVWVEPDAALDDVALPDGEFVVKPAVSAGARNTSRYGGADHALAMDHIGRLLGIGRTVMVQPYVAAVDREGEAGLIYIAGRFSHGVRKGPLLQRTGQSTPGLWEPERITPGVPSADERALAEHTLDVLPWSRDTLLYARVDVVHAHDGSPMLLELELAEPSLFLQIGDGAAARFADAIVASIDAE